MSGLPRRFAKMGFKAGWRAFKRSKSSPRTARASSSNARRSGGGGKVARRKRKGFRRSRSRGSGGGLSPLEGAGYGAAFGVAAPRLLGFAQQIAPQVNPRLILGGASALAAWKGRGMVKKAGIAGLTVLSSAQAQATTAGLMMAPGNASNGSVYL